MKLDRRAALTTMLALLAPLEAALVGCRRHDWQGHLRLDGVYRATVRPPNDAQPVGTYRFLRFLADGRVLHTLSSTDAAFAGRMLVPGFVETSNRGSWSNDGDRISITLRGDSVQHIEARELRGTITPERAALDWQGSDGAPGPHEQFDFVQVPVFDL